MGANADSKKHNTFSAIFCGGLTRLALLREIGQLLEHLQLDHTHPPVDPEGRGHPGHEARLLFPTPSAKHVNA